MDINGDGVVTMEEFVELCSNVSIGQTCWLARFLFPFRDRAGQVINRRVGGGGRRCKILIELHSDRGTLSGVM